ncbi:MULTISPECIES: hydroxyacid dehydrogenase [Dethiosulfovibrio]|jgi:D-3-phosphoglycerate dehydrogenase|uniref:Hydroxyacid dehydrogenase n=2 Tax=Dethiosulfovibrio TaxID=47054 RepID=A0ABS9ETD0_9BACT|nr:MULTISPECIES: hydroxyacid dehydrogenase [Dethiosulfovibrio]MCF4114737.1 hydroxyacid dehydrogenase [Dethiosulfovibrio russensis]MCF4143058.1 hydroxyacid dehydrogenase [Dethiosulfovibrio marinus]MCF4145242.1 hydroxyacid dehydrogenase [Dethiosulfovibrio acidaminovorans]MEA3285133.1 hydroxyacid dehydrogenase [Synergistota bacterium]
MLILISDAFDPSLPDRLSRFGEVTDDTGRLPEADVVLVRSKTKCTRDYIEKASNLKLIIRGGVGTDNIDKEFAASKGISVRNTPKASSVAVAELAFAMMLAVPNRLVEAHNSMVSGAWEKKKLKRTELYGKKLTLFGLGNIAAEVGKRALAFGMKVSAYDPFVNFERASDLGVTLVSDVKEAVSKGDYISLHLPLTDDTRGLINSDVIEAMKDGAILVNTGRGLCVDAAAVAAALESGKLGAYCTDVWPSDPPAEDYPLLKAPRVLMAPHIGASTSENLLRIGDEVESIIQENLEKGVL